LIDGLGDIRLEVADLGRSVAFYRDGLRFVCEGQDEANPELVHFRAGNVHVVLAHCAPAAHRRRGAGIRVSIAVAGVDAYHDALVARGLNPSPPADDTQARRFTVQDPDGYQWVFVQSTG